MWMHAVQQLSMADIVYIIGYSLPDADYNTKYYLIKGLTRPNRLMCAKIKLINPNALKTGLDRKFRTLLGDIREVIGEHKVETIKIEIGDETYEIPSNIEYELGEKKLEIISKTFEAWLDEF